MDTKKLLNSIEEIFKKKLLTIPGLNHYSNEWIRNEILLAHIESTIEALAKDTERVQAEITLLKKLNEENKP